MRLVLMLAVLASALAGLAIPQKTDETTRKLWDTAFISSPTSRKDNRRRSRSYRIATPKIPIDKVTPESVVGVTIWRLRPSLARDSGERIIVHDDAATKQWMPERISPKPNFARETN